MNKSFLVYLSSLLFMLTTQINILLYEENFNIKFPQVIDITLNFTELLSNYTDKYSDKNPFLNIVATVSLNEDCRTSKNCNNPIVLYGKLNSAPEPDNLLYDVKDDNGQLIDNQIQFGFEFTPCQYKSNDILHIKVVGTEGKSAFTLKANYKVLSNYKVFCSLKEEEYPLLSFPSVADSEVGTFSFGGKNIRTNRPVNDLFLLNKSITWNSVNQQSKPCERYGALMKTYENMLILFGGKDANENSLNDLWVYDIDKNKWNFIDYQSSTNVPQPKFIPSGEVIENRSKLLIFGGEEGNSELCFLNLPVLKQLLIDQSDDSLINSLWTISSTQIQARKGLTITQISESEILFFGGFDKNNLAIKSIEILNILTLNVETTTPSVNSIFPSPRGFHQMIKYGKVLFLYGGESSNSSILNDIWKFVISTRTWIPLDQNKENEFFLYRSNFNFIKLSNYENPVIFRGVNRNKELTNDLIMLEFDLCLSDESIVSSFNCLPCPEGYLLVASKCEICKEGTYHNIYSNDYSNSKCEPCPRKTFNEHIGKRSISACQLCGYGFFNPLPGQKECTQCPLDEVCLPGSSQPTKGTKLKDKLEDFYLKEENYPDFISSNKKTKDSWQNQGFLVSLYALVFFVVIVIILDKAVGKKCHRLLISMDFLPITGGQTKRLNGGILFMLYVYFNIILILTFILRYIFYNDLTEVIPISSSHGVSLKSSIEVNIDLLGYEDACIDTNQKIDEKYHLCSSNLLLTYESFKDTQITNTQNAKCSLTAEGICRVTLICQNCEFDEKSLSIGLKVKSSTSFIQAYYWSLDLAWGETMNRSLGYSHIEGIFKPDENIKNNSLFKGSKPSDINTLLTPIYFTRKSENEKLQGYRLTFKSYERGSTSNTISSIGSENDETMLNIRVSYLYILYISLISLQVNMRLMFGSRLLYLTSMLSS